MTLDRSISAWAAASLTLLLGGCANMTSTIAFPAIPGSLVPPPTQVLALETHATGVQIYECRVSKDNPAHFDWVFVSPEATLVDNAGVTVAKHYAGPTWEAIDGSKVVGEVKARDDGPDAKAIPWLLLSAKSTSGSGMLNRTTFVQRINTIGGKAPMDCASTQAGAELRVPYEAKYNFYVAKP
jgi:Protein of unknown function (DUF3455)